MLGRLQFRNSWDFTSTQVIQEPFINGLECGRGLYSQAVPAQEQAQSSQLRKLTRHLNLEGKTSLVRTGGGREKRKVAYTLLDKMDLSY